MGKLINQERRAQARAAKQERKQQIIEAALEVFQRMPYSEVTLDGIGRKAKVKSGLASLYFGSKGELFLQLLSSQLAAWNEAMVAGLEALPADGGPAGLLAKSLSERPALVRLLSLRHVVIEETADVGSAMTFQQGLEVRMQRLGAALEEHCLGVPVGRGAWLVHRTLLLATGLRSAETPLAPEAATFQVDLGQELRALIEALLATVSAAAADAPVP